MSMGTGPKEDKKTLRLTATKDFPILEGDVKLMSVAEAIRAKLTAALSPRRLDIYDDSEKHRGHAGHREGGETHFRVTIISPAFEGLPRIDRHRQVNAALAEELRTRIHALQLTTLTPEEAAKRM
jgi:BolA protein